MTRATSTRDSKPKGVHKRRTTVEEIVPDTPSEQDELTDFDVALESVEDTEKLREVMESYGETGVLFKIYKQTPTGAQFCYRTDTLDEEFIQTNYGGGDYVARIYINGKYKRNLPVKIADKVVSITGGNSVADSHSSFLEKLVLAMIAKESHPVSTTPGPSITDLVTALSGIDNLRGKQESGLDMFMKGADFAKGLEGGEESWKSMLMRHAPQLLDGVSTIAGNIMGGKPRPVNPPMPVTTAVGDPPNTEAKREEPVQIGEAYFKEGLKFLKSRLIAGMQPDTVINWVFDNRDDPTYQPFLQGILSKPFEYFVSIDAEIGQEPFHSTFRYIYDGIRTLFAEEHQMDLDTGGSGGDSTNAGGNGSTGTVGNK